jgi:hypothetical protein
MTLEKDPQYAFREAGMCLVNKAAILRFHKTQCGSVARLVKRACAKDYILAVAKHTRYHPFSRVSADALTEVGAATRIYLSSCAKNLSDALLVEGANRAARHHCHKIVQRNPSIGRTLK